MLSDLSAGMLRVGIVLLAAGALAGGVYLLAQADDERAASSLETPAATALSPGPLSPPADIGAPPDVDTSGWLTYTSPLGFTIKYPPGWAVVIGDIPERAKIFNEKAQEERARRIAVGALAGVARGEAWIEISPDVYPHFVVKELLQICRPDNLSPSETGVSEPSEITFAGLPAVHCPGEVRDLYLVGLPSGRVIGITAYAVDVGDATAGLLQAIMATVSFEAPTATGPLSPPADIGAPPDVDTSGWPTYTSPLGFTIKYPPGWRVEEFENLGLPLGTARITKQHPAGTGEIVIEGGTVRLPPGLT
ncbi:MAG: hypothetical protein IIB19_07020, partial [Chloroflexi bacterium]|nr:hypothetical protein [Chloroflexota bacterium]